MLEQVHSGEIVRFLSQEVIPPPATSEEIRPLRQKYGLKTAYDSHTWLRCQVELKDGRVVWGTLFEPHNNPLHGVFTMYETQKAIVKKAGTVDIDAKKVSDFHFDCRECSVPAVSTDPNTGESLVFGYTLQELSEMCDNHE